MDLADALRAAFPGAKITEIPYCEGGPEVELRALRARVAELAAALAVQPAAEGHLSDIFCEGYHGKPCSCGHAVIAEALRRTPEAQ